MIHRDRPFSSHPETKELESKQRELESLKRIADSQAEHIQKLLGLVEIIGAFGIGFLIFSAYEFFWGDLIMSGLGFILACIAFFEYWRSG